LGKTLSGDPPVPRRSYSKPTINDVAAQARVSVTTVSHFVSGRSGACSPETARRIEAAISTLHYTPSSMRRGLSQKATQMLGVSVANPSDEGERPFSDRIWRGINREADVQDYALLHYPSSVRDSSDYRVFLDGRVDGLILSAGVGDPRIERLAEAGMPLVVLSHANTLPTGCGSVCADERQTVALALSHLWELGHRRIAHLAGPCDLDTTLEPPSPMRFPADAALQRRQAFRDWMAAQGVADPLVSSSHSWWKPGGTLETLAAWRALPEPPTSLFCANDAIALSAMEAARALDWPVPGALSVVGVDNSLSGSRAEPPLTTIELDSAALGHETVRCLLRLMDGAPAEECHVMLPVSRLLVRASTAAP